MTSNNPISNDSGFTLLELIVSVLVGSMVISMLMSILVMGLSAKARTDYNNRLFSESYFITEFIKAKSVELGTQEIDIVDNDFGPNTTTIFLRHLNDVTVVDNQLKNLPNLKEYQIVWDYNVGVNTITFYDENLNAVLLHRSSTVVTSNTNFTFEKITGNNCDYIISCDSFILTLDLELTSSFNGSELIPKKYKTTLII